MPGGDYHHLYPSGAAVCLALFHLRMRLISVRDGGDMAEGEGNDRTNPLLFAVAVGLEEIETFVAVVVVSVEAVHGRFGCVCTWA